MKCQECPNEVDLKAGDEVQTEIGPMLLGEEEPRLCRACMSKGWSKATMADILNDPDLRGKVEIQSPIQPEDLI